MGVGLINYHFQTKESLVTVCVQRIIEVVVSGFSPAEVEYGSDRERLTDWAAQVFEFLVGNAAISRISILGDMADCALSSNSARTQRGFAHALRGDYSDLDRALVAFALTSALQAAFLSRNIGKDLLGCDMDTPEGRRAFVARLVGMLLEGVGGRGFEMNRKIGVCASWINAAAVAGFAAAMLFGSLYASYLSSIFIAFSFVAMMCAFAHFGGERARTAGLAGVAFGAMYALVNISVYYIQLTTVRMSALNQQAKSLLDYSAFGMMFNMDLLGYCFMAVATFFAGFAVVPETRGDRWLRGLLLAHGVFAVTCFLLPLLGLFSPDMKGGEWIGTAILLFWCAYFLPVGILSARYFGRK